MDVETDLAGGEVERIAEGGRERHHRNRGGIDAEQEVQHRRVADDDHLVDTVPADTGRLIELGEDAVHGCQHCLA